MENKKLVNILLKDMGELEEMVEEIKNKGSFDSLEIEFLHTRAKGIVQLLQMLDGRENGNPVSGAIPKSFEKISEKVREEDVEVTESSFNKGKNILKPKKEEQVEHVKTQQDEVKEDVKESEELVSEKEIVPEKEEVDMGRQVVTENHSKNNEQDDMELEEEEATEPNQRLGDSFLKGKSVNDIIHDQNKLEFKLSNRPVSSIKLSIGINDRFQYIRELFDGSPERFTETVESLDDMNSINEAVVYLQQNFKWKKNETSLKFVNLVKRRFTNV